MTEMEYYKKMLPYAKIVEQKTGMDAKVVTAFWSWESGFGTNRGSTQLNNHAGIKKNSRGNQVTDPKGVYAGYKDLTGFANDYARVLKLSYYKNVLNTNQKDYRAVINAFNKSPYAEDDYNINTILSRIEKMGGVVGDPIGGSSTGNTIDLGNLGVENLGQADLKKYATIGLAIMSIAFILD